MRKPRSDSILHQLPAAQRATLESWLFEQHLGYSTAVTRLKDEFGVEISSAALCRYYQRRARQRQLDDLIEAQAMSDALETPKASTDAMRATVIKLIAKTTLKLACERPDQLEELNSMAKILLLAEDNDIRRGRLDLERDYFQYQAEVSAGEELPKLARLLRNIEADDNLSSKQKLHKIRAFLYPTELGVAKVKSGPMEEANAS